jgi:glycosyltransferase involved in cell wall biosynthesis
MKLVFWVSLGLLFYTYIGYHLLLRLAAMFLTKRKKNSISQTTNETWSVSVIIACYNEEKAVGQRIENLLALDYPSDLLEILIASDGSTDRTAECAGAYVTRGVQVLRLPRGGRAAAHNACVARSRGQLLVFTDADTKFQSNFLRVVTQYFSEDEKTGCVVGNLEWENPGATGESRFRGLSWRFEVDLKETETRLGILASACGAAMAVRKDLWKPMADEIDDVDSVTPLDVIHQGYRVVFAPGALAHETPFFTARGLFRSKVRGVSKSIIMIPRRWKPTEWLGSPLILFRTISHHVLRWVAPYFMLTLVVASLYLWNDGELYRGMVMAEAGVVLLTVIGYVASRLHRQVAVASMVSSFVVVNAGFALGLLKALVGAARGPYETAEMVR